VAVTDKGLTILNKQGYKQTIEADSIVPAVPMKPNNALLKSLEGKVDKIYSIGDCKEPHLIVDAIADAFHTARSI
jgi:thioredoxin reductase